jgi:hypothetical protein
MNNEKRGGRRAGAGGTITKIAISVAHARNLRTLIRAQGGVYGREAVARWVETQIAAEWAEFDADVEAALLD